jgi:hypothetical protein
MHSSVFSVVRFRTLGVRFPAKSMSSTLGAHSLFKYEIWLVNSLCHAVAVIFTRLFLLMSQTRSKIPACFQGSAAFHRAIRHKLSYRRTRPTTFSCSTPQTLLLTPNHLFIFDSSVLSSRAHHLTLLRLFSGLYTL